MAVLGQAPPAGDVRRGMELPHLVAKLAETVCRDSLFAAVLD